MMEQSTPGGRVCLTKHHGLGNDFLIALDPEPVLTSAQAKQWCDRRTGIGADGLIEARRNGGGWTMTLWNADGSRAEISGNGIRCLGQAIVMASRDDGETGGIDIETDAGPRHVTVELSNNDTWSVRVGMGRAVAGPDPSDGWAATSVPISRQLGVDVGNPHLVAVAAGSDAFESADMAVVGPLIEAGHPGGINVHLVRVETSDRIDLKVWERGVGVTMACGTGACAAAWATNHMGLTGTEIVVTMPGGSATVELTDDEVHLIGPATYVGSVLLG